MALIPIFTGGNKWFGPEQARLLSGFASGAWPAGALSSLNKRVAHRIQFLMSGTDPMFLDAVGKTLNGVVSDGDEFAVIVAPASTVYKGLKFVLKQALPSNLGLTINVKGALAATNPDPVPALADGSAATDTFTSRSVVIPAGSAAGFGMDFPLNTIADFANYGFVVSVSANVAANSAGKQVLSSQDLTNLQLALVLGVDDFQDDMEVACGGAFCNTLYPPLDCLRLGGTPAIPSQELTGTVSAAPAPVKGARISMAKKG